MDLPPFIRLPAKLDVRVEVIGNLREKRYAVMIGLSSDTSDLEALVPGDLVEELIAKINKLKSEGWTYQRLLDIDYGLADSL